MKIYNTDHLWGYSLWVVIKKLKDEIDNTVYIKFNGIELRISPDSSEADILEIYKLKRQSLR